MNSLKISEDDSRKYLLASRSINIVDNSDLYDVGCQHSIYSKIRLASPHNYDFLISRVLCSLSKKPYYVHISGIDSDTLEYFLLSLSYALGDVMEPYKKAWSQLIQPITPGNDIIFRGKSLVESFHSDSTDWNAPNDITLLACKKANNGLLEGTKILDIDTIESDLIHYLTRAELKIIRTKYLPWPIAKELGGNCIYKPILDRSYIRWSLHLLCQGVVEYGYYISPSTLKILNKLDYILNNRLLSEEVSMQDGDILILSNKRCLHARVHIEDKIKSSRLLLRTKVNYRK